MLVSPALKSTVSLLLRVTVRSLSSGLFRLTVKVGAVASLTEDWLATMLTLNRSPWPDGSSVTDVLTMVVLGTSF